MPTTTRAAAVAILLAFVPAPVPTVPSTAVGPLRVEGGRTDAVGAVGAPPTPPTTTLLAASPTSLVEGGAALYVASTAPVSVLAPAEAPPPPEAPRPLTDAELYRLRQCESTDRYAVDTGNGYYGAYQFDQPTWDATARRHMPWLVGMRPSLAAPGDQDQMTQWLWSERGRAPWPICGRRV